MRTSELGPAVEIYTATNGFIVVKGYDAREDKRGEMRVFESFGSMMEYLRTILEPSA